MRAAHEGNVTMAVEVAKIELKNVQDASGLEACIARGQFAADQVIAVIGKTEGNGGVNDFTRILADQAFRRVLQKHGKRSEAEIAAIPMVWSGGCDGVITPHATVFATNDKTGPPSKRSLAIGTAISAELLPEDIGRPAMVEKVADAVRAAMRDAGIDDPKDVHYVQTKTPLLTIESVRDAEARGRHVACEVHDSMGASKPTAAALCVDAARSCSTIPTCTIIGMPRPRSAAWRQRRSAIGRCSSRSMPCTRDRRVGDQSLPSLMPESRAGERVISGTRLASAMARQVGGGTMNRYTLRPLLGGRREDR